MKKVSVIVPIYKKYDNLKKNLISIFIQSYNEIELIITDDGSNNFDLEMIENLLNECREKRDVSKKRIDTRIIHHKKNLGTVKNLNEAIKLATGYYIFGLAQDDQFYDEKVIEKVVKNFKGDVCTTYRAHMLKNGKINILPRKKEVEKISKPYVYWDILINGNYISGAGTFWKKEIFEKYGLFDENMKLMEDYPYFLSLLRKNVQIGFIPIISLRYGDGGVSNTKNKSLIFINDNRLTFERELKYQNGIIKRALQYRINECKYVQKRCKGILLVYIKYFDIFAIKIINKILKINILEIIIKITKNKN